MKIIYFLHGYGSTGNKAQSLQKFYGENTDISLRCWDWNEHMNLPKFIEEKTQELETSMKTNQVILVADSMGGNLAWMLINRFLDLQYVFINPVFRAEQIFEQDQILPEMRAKIFTATEDNIKNRNGRLVISRYDKTLDSSHYQKIFGNSLPVLEIPEEHNIRNFFDYIPEIHKLILNAFECSEK